MELLQYVPPVGGIQWDSEELKNFEFAQCRANSRATVQGAPGVVRGGFENKSLSFALQLHNHIWLRINLRFVFV